MKPLLPTVLLLFSLATASRAQQTGNIVFSHDEGNGVMALFGTDKAENYDVAIHLSGKSMKGLTIKSVKIPVQTESVTNMTVWLSKELKTEVIDKKKVNVPDVSSQAVRVRKGWVEVMLTTPYTITEEGVHVGYSFEIPELDESNARPVIVTTDNSPGGFFVRSSRTYRSWEDKSLLCSSCLQVTLSGAKSEAAALGEMAEVYGGAGEPVKITLPVINHGFKGVKNFHYTYELDGKTHNGYVNLGADSIRSRYDMDKEVEVQISAVAEKGTYPISFTVTKVNGAENTDPHATAQTTLKIYASLPKHRAVMEEYTGCWCGYCPRGWAAMEMLNEEFPEDFIGLAYHSDDPMEVTRNFPSKVSGFPMCHIDRASGELDPFLGTGRQGTAFEIKEHWENRCKVTAPADVDIAAELSADGSTVDVTSAVYFPIPPKESGFKVEFVLVADSLTGSPADGWIQVNYFSGDKNYEAYEMMHPFINGGQYLGNLYYNDVVVASSRLLDDDALLPTEIGEGDRFPLTYRFDLTKVQNIDGKPVIQDRRNLRVVALLVAADGTIVNANKAKVNSDEFVASGIESVRTEAAAESRFDLSGRRLTAPQRGINILRTADGRTEKVLVK